MRWTDIALYPVFLWQYVARKGLGVARWPRAFLPRTRTSHPVSKALRPLAQARRFKTIVGIHLGVAMVAVNLMGDVGGQVQLEPVETAVLSPETVQVLTETRFRFPLDESDGYSQGFHRFHPGVDIRAPVGTAIYPLAAGEVIEVELSRWAYGHKVAVKHKTRPQSEGELTTLYAHLDKVDVKVSDQVSKDTVLGEVGMTGWTTGPHLHLEVRTDNGYINPKQILPSPVISNQ